MDTEEIPSALTSFAAGAVAGLTVDIALFPLDTLKTRIQSEQGFWKAGGFKNIYKGIGPTAAGSAPCAAIFFLTYNETKGFINPLVGTNWSPISHIMSASIAEVTVNLVKVPVEIVKQRRQTTHQSILHIVQGAVQREGLLGLYRGFASTVMRDIPFSVIQFPMWEAMKMQIRRYTGQEPSPMESALSGAISGAVAGAVTTPLDLAKTRIMLAEHSPQSPAATRMWPVLRQIYLVKGFQGLFVGFLPRTSFIFLGGGVFFGCYEYSKELVEKVPFLKQETKNNR